MKLFKLTETTFENYDNTVRSYLSKTLNSLGMQYTHSNIFGVIFDGVNQECVYTTYDFTNNRFLKNSEENMYYFTEYLDMLVQNGYVVYVLEYATDSKIRSKSYFYSMEHNYICYVSDNIELLMNN